MALTEGNEQGVLKGAGGQPGLQTNRSHEREQGYDNSPMAMTNRCLKAAQENRATI